MAQPEVQRWHRWVAPALGVAALALYLVSLHRDVAGGDSGEFAAVACSGGVLHPPGYPLHSLLSRLFLLLPFGVPAARVNALSAVSGALAVFAMAGLLMRLTRRPSAAVLGAGLFAVSPLVWEYARVAEVFSLNNALVALALWAALVDVEQRSTRSAALFGLSSGLALANHQTALFVLAPIGAWRLWQHPRAKVLVGAGLGGLSLYLTLLVTGRTATSVTWGDTTTLTGLYRHITRADYGTLQLANGGLATDSTSLGAFIAAYFKSETLQTFGIGLLFAIAGLVWSTRKTHTQAVRLTLGVWALYLGVFGSLSNLPLNVPLTLGVVSRFWQMPHLLLCLVAGLAVLWVPRERVTLPLSLALVLLLGVVNAREIEFGGNHLLRQFAEQILLKRRPNALAMVQGDVIGNPVRYLQACEHVRPDVWVIDQPQLTFDWHVRRLKQVDPGLNFAGTKWHPREPGTFTLKQFLTDNAARGPIDVCGHFKTGDDSAKELISLWPDGLCEWVVFKGAGFDVDAWLNATRNEVPAALSAPGALPGTWEREVATEYWQQRAGLALKTLNAGIEHDNDARYYQRAVELFKDIEARAPEKNASFYKNFGIAAGRLAQTDPTQEALMFEMLGRFVKLGDKRDPDYAKLKQAVDQWQAKQPPH